MMYIVLSFIAAFTAGGSLFFSLRSIVEREDKIKAMNLATMAAFLLFFFVFMMFLIMFGALHQ